MLRIVKFLHFARRSFLIPRKMENTVLLIAIKELIDNAIAPILLRLDRIENRLDGVDNRLDGANKMIFLPIHPYLW